MPTNTGAIWRVFRAPSIEEEMAAFDSLPRSHQQLLRETPLNFSAYQIKQKFPGISAMELRQLLERASK